jgi:hypothetical protein
MPMQTALQNLFELFKFQRSKTPSLATAHSD